MAAAHRRRLTAVAMAPQTGAMAYQLFWSGLLLLVSAGALLFGGAPERIVAAVYLVSVPLTDLVYASNFGDFELGPFLVDSTLLTIFVGLALVADRFWTLWLVALQATSVLAYSLGSIDAFGVNTLTAILVQIWFYPIMALIAVGTIRHRLRMRVIGADKAWSHSWRSLMLTRQKPRPTV